MTMPGRVILSLVIITVSASGLYWLCYRPYRCNELTRSIKARTLNAWSGQTNDNNFREAAETRRRLEVITACLSPSCASVEAYMIAAANCRLLKRYEDAARLYRGALDYDQRPEIYFNLGLVEVASGDRERGIADLVLAGRTNAYWNQIEDEPLRAEVARRLFHMPAPRF